MAGLHLEIRDVEHDLLHANLLHLRILRGNNPELGRLLLVSQGFLYLHLSGVVFLALRQETERGSLRVLVAGERPHLRRLLLPARVLLVRTPNVVVLEAKTALFVIEVFEKSLIC